MKWALIGICLLLVASVVADTSSEESAAILSSSEESSVAKSSSEETSAAKSSSEETSAAKSSSEETSAAKSSSEETSAAKFSSEETSAAKSSSEETSAAKSSSEETSAAKSSSEETSAAKSSSEETLTAESSSEETSGAKSSSEETSAAKSSSEETSAANSSPEDSSAEKSSSEESSVVKPSSEESAAADSSSEESKDKTSESSESNESTDESNEESEESTDGLRLAEPCDEEACHLPDCRCSSTNIPGGLNARDVPQFVLVTFDDAVNGINAMTYRSIMYDRVNTNGCPIGTTFFVNHEYTNYQIVNELYNEGFEIALHSVSHQTPQSYWAQATYEDMKLEFADQKLQMSHFANIPYDDIKGIRIPFLQMTGNSSFQVMADFDLLYDSTWPAQIDVDPGLWPYTLDYASTQDCVIPPCPTASIPGVWVLPMVAWLDLEGLPCSMVDSCFHVPDHEDEEAWFRFIVTNFERHYLGNRAPFPFYIHEWYLAIHPAVRSAFTRFLNMINSLNDVYMVNSKEVIDWVKRPIPIDEYRQKPCRELTRRQCMFNGCGPLYSDHNIWSSFWMQICTFCPRVYPWLGNPLGQ